MWAKVPLLRMLNGIQEEFIRYLAEQSHNVVKSERKPRRNIAYKDIGRGLPWHCANYL